MTAHRPEDFARQFPENGLKLLLQWPLNVRDALRIARYTSRGLNWLIVEQLEVECQ